MDPQTEEARALVQSEEGVRGVVMCDHVFDPFIFSPDFVQFTAKEYVFLRHFRLGTLLSDAAVRAGMTVEQAERFLAKDKTRLWLKDRAEKDHIKAEWSEPGKWWQKGEEWLEGKGGAKPSKNEVEIWKEFGKRVQPCSEGHGGTARIEITIEAGALERSRERRRSIDAQVAEEP